MQGVERGEVGFGVGSHANSEPGGIAVKHRAKINGGGEKSVGHPDVQIGDCAPNLARIRAVVVKQRESEVVIAVGWSAPAEQLALVCEGGRALRERRTRDDG